MRNLDAIINQLSNEQQRCSSLLLEDMNKVKAACKLFFDKQTRELENFKEHQQKDADGFFALLNTSLEDIMVKVQNGYPREQKPEMDTDPLPAIVTGRKLTPDEASELEKALDQAVKGEKL